jgi:hypothetical protein
MDGGTRCPLDGLDFVSDENISIWVSQLEQGRIGAHRHGFP